MCTYTLHIDDALVERVRPTFSTHASMEKWLQEQAVLSLKQIEKEQQNIRPFEALSPEIQKILQQTEPMKGILPAWDLEGDTFRIEAEMGEQSGKSVS